MKHRVNFVIAAVLGSIIPACAFAQDAAHAGGQDKGLSLIAAGLAIGLAALGGTFGQARAVSASLESIGRNPGASSNLFVPMLLGLAFIESLVVIAFVIAFTIAGKV